MKKSKLLRKGAALLLSAAMVLGMMPVIERPLKVQAEESTEKTIAGLGTSVLVNPVEPEGLDSAWRGSYVYFGKYNYKPVKYRVLSTNTTEFSEDSGTKTMLLDCNSVLFNSVFHNSSSASAPQKYVSDWNGSSLQTYLNSTFLNNFTSIEKGAITESTKTDFTNDPDGSFGGYSLPNVALNGDKVFLLDSCEAIRSDYGYSCTPKLGQSNAAANRIKKSGSGEGVCWWLRTPADSNGRDAIQLIDENGHIGGLYHVFSHEKGVSPVLNVDLSSVLFSSVVSGEAGQVDAEYKLTLFDSDLSVAQTAGQEVTRNSDTVTVPYTIIGNSAGNATQVSYLITDKEWQAGNTDDTSVLAYGKIDVDNFSKDSTGTFTLPEKLSDKRCGTDYYAYIVAEEVNEGKLTDYASTPAAFSIPDKPFEAPEVYTMNIGTKPLYFNYDTGWKAADGVKVYYGGHEVIGSSGDWVSSPMLYRVLGSSPDTQSVADGCILLDADTRISNQTGFQSKVGANAEQTSGKYNEWNGCDLEIYLNDLKNNSANFYNSSSVFKDIERAAIQKTTLMAKDTYSITGEGSEGYSYKDYSAEDYIFILSAQEADTLYADAAARAKYTYGTYRLFLRSAIAGAPEDSNASDKDVAKIDPDGNFTWGDVISNITRIYPAFNFSLSSVLFTNATAMDKSASLTADSENLSESAYTGNKVWELTMKDSSKTAAIQEGKDAVRTVDGTITVPYTYTDTASADTDKVNQISVMITDKAYSDANTEDAKILYYGALQNIKDADGNESTAADASTGTGTFVLPGALSDKTLGVDYHVYILPERVNGEKWTDFAGAPVEVTSTVDGLITINSAAVTDIEAPAAGTALDTQAVCEDAGISNTTPAVTWTPADTTAGYNTVYRADVTLSPAEGYMFADSMTATVNGNEAQTVTKNENGTVTVTYTFDATAKDKLVSITALSPLIAANGTAYADMNLPSAVHIETEGGTVDTAQVTWDTTTPADGNYDPDVLTEQTVTLNGTVICPDTIDDNGVSLTASVTIIINAAGIVGAPTADIAEGTYTENQTVTLSSSTEGADIYYTTDGSVPALENGVPTGTTVKYEGAIAVSGTEGLNKTTTIKAIAVKDRMQNSSVVKFTYTISIPKPTYKVTVTNGTGGGSYYAGDIVKITADTPVTGQRFSKWTGIAPELISSGSLTSSELEFEMPAGEVSVTADYVKVVNSVAITDLIAPAGGTAFDTEALCQTEGVKTTTPSVMWDTPDQTAGYNMTYRAEIYLELKDGYEFETDLDKLSATVNGVKKNIVIVSETSAAVFCSFDTAKDKLVSITAPAPVIVANGTGYDKMNLPSTVTIETEGHTLASAPVIWNTVSPAGGSYDPAVKTEQTVTLNGTVTCPDTIDVNGVSLTTNITITISAAGIAGAPTASLAEGTYMEAQSVMLMSSTEGADIYYTTDGSEPALENGVPVGTTVKYEGAIAVPGTAGADVTTVIKAVAVKEGMQTSAVMTFTYTVSIGIPVTNHKITVTKGIGGTVTPDGTVEVADGDCQTFTITPDEGYEIEALKVDGEVVSASGVYTFTDVTADHTLEVTFKKSVPMPTPSKTPQTSKTPSASATPAPSTVPEPSAVPSTVPEPSAEPAPSTAPEPSAKPTPSTAPEPSKEPEPSAVPQPGETTVPTPTPTQAAYVIIDGADSNWLVNTDGNLVIRGDGEVSKFTGVKVDGSLIGKENYTVESYSAEDGSTLVTLKADYLKTLSMGSHTFEIVWTDGTAETTFTVAENASGDNNKKDGNDGVQNSTDKNIPTSVPEVAKSSEQNVTADNGNTAAIAAPKTADNAQTAFWMTIMAAVMAGFAGSLVVKKRKG